MHNSMVQDDELVHADVTPNARSFLAIKADHYVIGLEYLAKYATHIWPPKPPNTVETETEAPYKPAVELSACQKQPPRGS